jgi:hypothetical protein
MKLVIIFAVGAIMCAIGVLWLVNSSSFEMMNNLNYLLFLMSGGGVMMMVSAHFGLRKLGRYLDR